MTREQRRSVLSEACPLWFVLDEKVKEDLISGQCIYMQHECVPIIDYSRKHPIFAGLD